MHQKKTQCSADVTVVTSPLLRWTASVRADGLVIELGTVWGWDGESAVFAAEVKWGLNMDELATFVCIELLLGTDQAGHHP